MGLIADWRQLMKNILAGIGMFILMLLKGIVWIVLTALKLVLELAKIVLLLFGMVMRLFLVFVKAGTP